MIAGQIHLQKKRYGQYRYVDFELLLFVGDQSILSMCRVFECVIENGRKIINECILLTGRIGMMEKQRQGKTAGPQQSFPRGHLPSADFFDNEAAFRHVGQLSSN